MSQKHQIFHHKFVKVKDKLIIDGSDTNYRMFIAGLEEGQKVEIFMEANEDNGTVPQLAKVHVCIRELAKELGYSFEDMKLEIKRRSGLCVKKEMGGELFMVCKSLADASKEELAMVVETLIQVGDTVNINFR